ncbi:hypothetical protein SBA2_70040 [Acidobacteriia bacterium SbA2]|nr:hypothetical protein SBA2_70040 [Acidobacteriia bacterium SbA2]
MRWRSRGLSKRFVWNPLRFHPEWRKGVIGLSTPKRVPAPGRSGPASGSVYPAELLTKLGIDGRPYLT